jgi:hypothetical protein
MIWKYPKSVGHYQRRSALRVDADEPPAEKVGLSQQLVGDLDVFADFRAPAATRASVALLAGDRTGTFPPHACFPQRRGFSSFY